MVVDPSPLDGRDLKASVSFYIVIHPPLRRSLSNDLTEEMIEELLKVVGSAR